MTLQTRAEALRRQRTSNAALSDEEVARIKRNLAGGMSPREIAQAYGVGAETIRKIARGDTYHWVTTEPLVGGDELTETLVQAKGHVALPQTMLDRMAAASFEKLRAMGLVKDEMPAASEPASDLPTAEPEPESASGLGAMHKLLAEANAERSGSAEVMLRGLASDSSRKPDHIAVSEEELKR